MPTDPRHWSDRAVRVFDHGAGRKVNRYEVCVCSPGEGAQITIGWYDTIPQAQRRRAEAAATVVAWVDVAHQWERLETANR